jgi:uncharacterized protein
MKNFEPHPLLRGAHRQTVAYAVWRRSFPALPPGVSRDFETEPGTSIRGECHWQPEPSRRPTLLLVHGLEGSSKSGYMMGLAEMAFHAGWNAVRLNQRNCGDSESLTPTLYNSGLSNDYRAVLFELIERDTLQEIFFAGYSMGGNLVLKMAGELADASPSQLRGVVGVCPSLDLSACVDALGLSRNFLYERRFVASLKDRMRRKAQLFPGKYDLSALPAVHTVREFDDAITATYCGFDDAEDYYTRSSALRVAGKIRVPSMLLIARDDPFVPFSSFEDPAIARNPHIEVVAPARGGHCAFISRDQGAARFWGEMKVMEFCRSHSKLLPAISELGTR